MQPNYLLPLPPRGEGMQKAPNFASLTHIRFAEFLPFIDVSIISHTLPEVKHPNLLETGGDFREGGQRVSQKVGLIKETFTKP